MPGACNDCGAAFKGDVKAHYDDAHPGSERFRYRDVKGVSHLICADCGHDMVEGKHLSVSKADTGSGKSADPLDFFDLHLQSHRRGED